ncbi:hypothetical protein [Nocardia aurantiaca]|uniref:Uncharacterized protein n=1 Tax=Nocardia aurantiaca TaxID=2675850 RepID=A0A6I3L8V1_9NOCA|nr:hypothetical protein [Nocardia aurantiaca]MTE16289.1 hypothetical protein [Nocardia aurantiaca]
MLRVAERATARTKLPPRPPASAITASQITLRGVAGMAPIPHVLQRISGDRFDEVIDMWMWPSSANDAAA